MEKLRQEVAYQSQRAEQAERIIRESQIIKGPLPIPDMYDPDPSQQDRRDTWQQLAGKESEVKLGSMNPQDTPGRDNY